jgi:hypothetical protein
MSVVNMTLRLDGQRPLLMNSSAKADPLNPIKIELDRLTSKRDKTAADHEQIAKAEWHGGLWLHDGNPCIPSEAIESAFNAAARTRLLLRVVVAAVRRPEGSVLVVGR